MIQAIKKTFEYILDKRTVFCFVILFLFFFSLSAAVPALAIDVGMEFGEKTGLPGTDPRVVAARLIQTALGFLGIIAVGLIMYGGFLWMTSNGNEEQIAKAKKTLINAIIGLVIILSSFAITTFVLSRILEATGGKVTTGSGPNVGGSGGIGAVGNCSVENLYPPDGKQDVPRNTSIMITFREEMDSSTICEDGGDGRCQGDPMISDGRIRLRKSSDDPSNYLKDVRVYDSGDRKTFIFVPEEYLGSPSEYIWYNMLISNDDEDAAGDILEADGDPVFEDCHNNYVEWKFEVSNKLDLTPPQVRRVSTFPPPDNYRDLVSVVSDSERARGSIEVNSLPAIHSPANLTSSRRVAGPEIDSVQVNENAEQGGELTLTVSSDGITAQLRRGNTLLGSSRFSERSIDFPKYFKMEIAGQAEAGNEWVIEIEPRTSPDSIAVSNDIYTFVQSAQAPNQITVGSNAAETAANIASVIDGRDDINASASGNTVEIEARIAGEEGNDIQIETSNDSSLSVSPMRGGSDRAQRVIVKGEKDQPMNSMIQITFNEAVMPASVSGPASEISENLRVVNADPNAGSQGELCDLDSDCLSFNCNENNRCEGTNNYLPGTFRISNEYRTVEFISENQCGVNGCGEPIYCLPKNSHLQVEVIPASLSGCSSDTDCSSKNPYSSCIEGVCKQDLEGNYPDSRTRNYPASDIEAMDGVMDAASNSLDGDRNSYAEGPEEWFSDNKPIYSSNESCQQDISEIIEAIVKKRKEEKTVLGEITGSFDSASACSDPGSAACLAAQRMVMRAVGISNDVKRDKQGGIFIIDENEDEPGVNACIPDTVSSPLCGSVDIPMYFCDEGDNISWNFYISEEMEIDPPRILNTSPGRGSSHSLSSAITAEFNKRLSSHTLKTGSTEVENSQGETIVHKNINLWSLSELSPGYWISSKGLDSDLDGQNDRTKVFIRHSMLSESLTYRVQIGSGVKDIYQNCFKPSSGPACSGAQSVTDTRPSCCNGNSADALGSEGNCR